MHHMGVVVAARDHSSWLKMLTDPSTETRLLGCHMVGEQLKDPLIAALMFEAGISPLKAIRKHIRDHPGPDCQYGTNNNVI